MNCKFIEPIRSLLGFPRVFRLFRSLIGGPNVGTVCAERHIRARPGNRILDIGCGTANILEYLPSVEYIGFDMNPKYIAYASARHKSRGQFICKTLTRETVVDYSGFDIVLALAVLHHLSDEEALQLFRIAQAALKPGGRLITLDGCYTENQSALEKFILSQDRGRYVRPRDRYIELARQVFPQVEPRTYTGLLLFPYTHLFMECR